MKTHTHTKMRFGGPFGPRARRGSVKYSLLKALEKGSGHGYELIGRIGEKTEGRWAPGPGSVYPTLEGFVDQDFATVEEQAGKKIYTITDKGLEELARLSEIRAEHRQGGDPSGLREAMMTLMGTVRSSAGSASAEDRAEMTRIIKETTDKVKNLIAKDD